MNGVVDLIARLRAAAQAGGMVPLSADVVRDLADALEAREALRQEVAAVRAAQDDMDATALRARKRLQMALAAETGAQEAWGKALAVDAAAQADWSRARLARRQQWGILAAQVALLAVCAAVQIWWGMR